MAGTEMRGSGWPGDAWIWLARRRVDRADPRLLRIWPGGKRGAIESHKGPRAQERFLLRLLLG